MIGRTNVRYAVLFVSSGQLYKFLLIKFSTLMAMLLTACIHVMTMTWYYQMLTPKFLYLSNNIILLLNLRIIILHLSSNIYQMLHISSYGNDVTVANPYLYYHEPH